MNSEESPSGIGWLRLDSGYHDGKFNMDFDLGLVGRFNATGIPILRFYSWKPYCISLGRNQELSDIDVILAKEDGIDVVKRPTGGKAVLHAEELTYSVVMGTFGKSVSETYNMISSALVSGLRTLGADLHLSPSSADFRKLFRDPAAIPCFSTSAVHEVEYKGRKLVGSAQHRFGDVLLQHGSILTGDYHKNLVKYLRVGEEIREKTRRDLDEHTITLRDILGTETESGSLRNAVASGFEQVFGAEFVRENEDADRQKKPEWFDGANRKVMTN